MESRSEIRVRYAETDQMGVAYHANYLVWCEVGRTDLIRELGMSYAEMEARGVLLAVSDVQLRYRASAKYDDLVRIVTTLTGVRSRMVTFNYELYRVTDEGQSASRLASATMSLVSIDRDGRPVALPADMRTMLEAAV
jgi:acyl-CoA thioester hydrolase